MHTSSRSVLAACSALLLLLAAEQSFAEDVKLVANKSIGQASLSKVDVKAVFLGKKTRLKQGGNVSFVVLKDGRIHKTFLRIFVGKSAAQFKMYWKKRVFTGKSSMPKVFASEAELLVHVVNTPGCLAYASAAADTSNLSIMDVTE